MVHHENRSKKIMRCGCINCLFHCRMYFNRLVSNRIKYFNKGGCGETLKRRLSCGYKERISISNYFKRSCIDKILKYTKLVCKLPTKCF